MKTSIDFAYERFFAEAQKLGETLTDQQIANGLRRWAERVEVNMPALTRETAPAVHAAVKVEVDARKSRYQLVSARALEVALHYFKDAPKGWRGVIADAMRSHCDLHSLEAIRQFCK